jgi:chromate transporter
MSDRPSALRLALTFSQIALASFGGGLSAWSHEVVVRRRGWLDERSFSAPSRCAACCPAPTR